MKKLLVAYIALASIALWAGGCASSKDSSGSTDPVDSAATSSTGPGAEPSTTSTQAGEPAEQESLVVYRNESGDILCPVMNTVIESEDKAVGHADYNGKRYYFCCTTCPPLFEKNKDKYAK